MRLRLLLLAVLCLLPLQAFAQSIVPSGHFTPGHALRSLTPSGTVAGDAGGAAGSTTPGSGYLTELGITNTGLPYCINDALTNNTGGYHWLCMGANVNGLGPEILSGSSGGASVLPLTINGTVFPIAQSAQPPIACTNTSTDQALVQNALNAGTGAVQLVAMTTCQMSGTLTVPCNTTLWSAGNPMANPPTGAVLTFPASVTTRVWATCGAVGSSSQGGIKIQGIAVKGLGSPIAGSVGILIQDTWSLVVRDVVTANDAIGMRLQSDSIYGIDTVVDNFQSCAATDAHMELVNWIELHANFVRLGCNGNGDVAGNAYVRLTNNGSTSVAGPNTIYFTNPIFNQGTGNNMSCAISFVNMKTNTANPALPSEFEFANAHVENATAGICSDSNTPLINRLTIVGGEWQNDQPVTGPGQFPFWSLNSGTTLEDVTIVGTKFPSWSDWTLAPTGSAQVAHINCSACIFNGTPVVVTGTTGSNVNIDGTFSNNPNRTDGASAEALHVSGVLGPSRFSGNIASGILVAPAFAAGATTPGSPVEFDIPGMAVNVGATQGALTGANQIGLTFGGGNTGLTYAANNPVGFCTLMARKVWCNISVGLTSKGSSTGMAEITGLPLSVSSASGVQSCYNLNMTGLTPTDFAILPETGTQKAQFSQQAATGRSNILDTQFTNTSAITCTFEYIN